MSGLVGIDVGGTFTDLYFSEDGITATRVLKVPSTPEDPSHGLVNALSAAGLNPADVGTIVHGTTIATNAVIEKSGARCALITTKGFRDVLELGRRDRQRVYGLTGSHVPLVPRALRWEVNERIDHRGSVLVALNDAEVRELGLAIKTQDVQAVVVSFLHSYSNPSHEQRVRAILQEVDPNWEVVISSDVVREYMEFERTSTAVVQGYLQPLVARYASNLGERLHNNGYSSQVLIMQSNGGLVPLKQLSDRAAYIVRSGPAAGVMAASRIAAQAGFTNVITGDMGGTSYDVAVVVDGKHRVAETTDLDFRIPLHLPMIDVHTIGAGGGSIAYLDRGGTLQVGPRSAGANPGPVCFGRGGSEPTVTDANAVLGRINANNPIGIKHRATLDIESARAAMAKLGDTIGLDVDRTALAILTLVNHRMAGRTRLLTVERGYDPRDFALVAFGGAGPLHGAAIMKEVGVRTMLIPPYPGVLCALGCAIADLRYDMSQTVERRLDELDPAWVKGIIETQRAEGLKQINDCDMSIDRIVVTHAAEMSYIGQIHSLRVDIDEDGDRAKMILAFQTEYRRQYGNVLSNIPISLVGLKTTVTGIRIEIPQRAATVPLSSNAVPSGSRIVYFDHPVQTAIYDRATLKPGMTFAGPAIVEQPDTTSVIEPGMHARVDALNNIVVEMQE